MIKRYYIVDDWNEENVAGSLVNYNKHEKSTITYNSANLYSIHKCL